jgi:predicted transcriptional regulator
MALKYLANQGWVKSLEKQSIKKGRPLQKYALAIPVKEIMARIEMQKKNEANNQLALIKKMRSYI